MQNKKGFVNILIIVIVAVIIAAIGGYIAVKISTASKAVKEISAQKELVKNSSVDQWSVYNDKKYGFEFKYPENWSVRVAPKLNIGEKLRLELLNPLQSDLGNIINSKDFSPIVPYLSVKSLDGFKILGGQSALMGYLYDSDKKLFVSKTGKKQGIFPAEATISEINKLRKMPSIKTNNGLDVLVSPYLSGSDCYGYVYNVINPLKKIILTSSFGFCAKDGASLRDDLLKKIIDSQYYLALSDKMEKIVESINF